MVRCDALIVGGGPAGSTCAWALRRAGWSVVVLDRARFPRNKVCAGWVTPGVFRLLELDPEEYRATGLTIQDIRGFRTSVLPGEVGRGLPGVADAPPRRRRRDTPAAVAEAPGDVPRAVETRYPHVVSYAIRRCEFDHYLLSRAVVRVEAGTALESMERRGDRWIVNGMFDTPVVVGAGGHFCPVARRLQDGTASSPPVVAKEAEFPLRGDSAIAPDVPELFFCGDLEGYGWCVRKGDYLNIGIGRRDGSAFNSHVDRFIEFLIRTGKSIDAADVRWCGHAYLAAGTGPRPLVADGVLLAGDAAGLAYPESGEGIRPAVESGRLAAETLLAAGNRFDRHALEPYAASLRRLYPPARRTPKALTGAVTALGRRLLRSPAFTRHVVIDRWFLRQ